MNGHRTGSTASSVAFRVCEAKYHEAVCAREWSIKQLALAGCVTVNHAWRDGLVSRRLLREDFDRLWPEEPLVRETAMEEYRSQSNFTDAGRHGVMLQPVGIIKNNIKEPILAAGDDGIRLQGELDAVRTRIREMHQQVSHIVIDEHLIDILDGIEDYSHLVVLYWAHKVPEESRSLTKVHPMGREEYPLVGIFCTCSPARPNPVLMTVVRLCGRRENVLEVTGLDAVDGSPVIDIKPYVEGLLPREETLIPEWMHKIQKEVEEGSL